MNTEIDRWKNRRAMAWTCMVAGLLFPALLLVTESDQLGAISGPFYVFVSAVVGAYVGFATLDDRWQNEASRWPQCNDDWRRGSRYSGGFEHDGI